MNGVPKVLLSFPGWKEESSDHVLSSHFEVNKSQNTCYLDNGCNIMSIAPPNFKSIVLGCFIEFSNWVFLVLAGLQEAYFVLDGLNSSGCERACTSASTPFFTGDYGSFRIHLPTIVRHNGRRNGGTVSPRAAADDVPEYKGYPPMTKKPKWWWRTLACIPYLMPLHETWLNAETVYNIHPFLEEFEYLTYPFFGALFKLPQWFFYAYFFVAYLGIVRNNKWPHFIRFHTITAMLLEITLSINGTIFTKFLPKGVFWGKIGMHYWLFVAFAFLFTVIECMRCALRGMYADVPFIADASYMQIPY